MAKRRKNNHNNHNKKKQENYVRAYKRQLARKGHPKETSKRDPTLLVSDNELELQIQELEQLYGPRRCGRWDE